MPDIRRNTTILDNFNYAAQVPLTGSPAGNWARLDTARNPLSSDGTKAVRGPSGTCYSYWTPTPMDGDEAEIWAYAKGGNASGQQWGVALASSPGGSSAADGYQFRIPIGSVGGDTFLERFTNMSFTTIAAHGSSPPSGGEFLALIRRNGSAVEGWWSGDNGATWTLSLTANDTTYTTNLYGVLEIAGTLVGWDYFGIGGAIQFVPQIYRRVVSPPYYR